MKEEKFERAEIYQRSVKQLARMYAEASFSEIVMVFTSWFLQRKKSLAGRNLPIKRHGNDHFIILLFASE